MDSFLGVCFYLKCVGLKKMYEIQAIISACAEMTIQSEESPGHQQCCWGLILLYFKG